MWNTKLFKQGLPPLAGHGFHTQKNSSQVINCVGIKCLPVQFGPIFLTIFSHQTEPLYLIPEMSFLSNAKMHLHSFTQSRLYSLRVTNQIESIFPMKQSFLETVLKNMSQKSRVE